MQRRPVSPLLQLPLLWSAAALGALAISAACSPGSSADPSVIVGRSEGGSGGDGGTGGEPPILPVDPGGEDLYDDPPPPGCADFELNDDEACDDGNLENGDGCSGNCLVVEIGYECPVPGSACVLAELCGDSRRVGGEQCDDGNAEGGDGCSSTCRLENGFVCPTLGEPCESIFVCSDGVVLGPEQCDDGNATAGDGCSDTCVLEEGWECLFPGVRCTPICGDGLQRGREQCDDGGLLPEDGCDAQCRLEPGFACDAPGAACRQTVCQDGTDEGSEACDDGNDVPFDGCSPSCVNEPSCGFVNNGYACGAVCGDGQKFIEEQCDDGNTLADDGCSPTCTLELGYDCVNQAPDLGGVIELPVILRDFQDNHPQFEVDPGPGFRTPGMVLEELDDDGKPEFNPLFSFDPDGDGGVTARVWTLDGRKPANNGGNAPLATPAAIGAAFAQWYRDDATVNRTEIGALALTETALNSGIFQFAASGENQFFPLDGLGFGNQTRANNFHFTSETRQWFEHDPVAGELLEFTGDDDVWVFVNGRLTVDLGGIHGEISGSIELLGDGGEDSILCINEVVGGLAADGVCNPFPVDLNPEGVNEIVVYQAERHVTLSNYTLTLRGFNAPITVCQPDCGDGELTPDETCDNGDANGTGYNECVVDLCIPGPRCGDGNVDEGFEDCDNGVNRDSYLVVSGESCAPGCVTPSRCGDAVVDGGFGEECDDGVNDNAYDGCSPECRLGPRCGDGEVNGPEQCDDGNRRNSDGCNVNCVLERDPA